MRELLHRGNGTLEESMSIGPKMVGSSLSAEESKAECYIAEAWGEETLTCYLITWCGGSSAQGIPVFGPGIHRDYPNG